MIGTLPAMDTSLRVLTIVTTDMGRPAAAIYIILIIEMLYYLFQEILVFLIY